MTANNHEPCPLTFVGSVGAVFSAEHQYRIKAIKILAAMVIALSFGLGVEVRAAASNAGSVVKTAAPAPPPSAPAKRSAAELEELAMPIALHPDPLISVILPASVYPVEIVMAARFVKDTNNIAKLDTQPWDESVKAVARYPELVAKMDADLNWTAALGQAFLDQRKELLEAIQALRLKAQKAGTLQTTPQQVVTVTNTIVERTIEQQVVVVTNTIVQIQPSNPEIIYVPSYPATVYYPPPVYSYGYSYYSYGYYPYAPLMTFSAGFFWGAAFSHWNHCDWHGGDININSSVNIGNRNDFRRDQVNPLGDRAGDRAGNRGDRVNPLSGDRGGRGQSWQPDQGRLQRAGAPTAKTREARGWSNRAGSGIRQSLSAGGTRPSQPSPGAGQRPATQPSRSPATAQRPSATQRPSQPSSSVNRSTSQRSGAFSGVNSGGGNTRDFSNRGSSSRGGGGFSGGGGGGARGGGGRGGGGRR